MLSTMYGHHIGKSVQASMKVASQGCGQQSGHIAAVDNRFP